VGNRLVLTGALLYLLEWVAIITARLDAPLGAGAPAQSVVAAYSGHAEWFAWAAGWFSVVLLGRILIMAGLRTALADSGRPQPVMDLAVAAMTVSVAIEIAAYAVVAGGAWSFAHGGTSELVRGLDAVAFVLNQMVFGPLGVSLVCAGVAMWKSQLLGRALPSLGLVAGALLSAVGLALTAPRYAAAAQGFTAAVALFWIWMLWLGVVLWRRRSAVPTNDRTVGR
jgi:hypothetical protein